MTANRRRLLPAVILPLTLGAACARQDRDAAAERAAAASEQAQREARELGDAAAQAAHGVTEQVRDATAVARDEVAEALLALQVRAALLDRLGIDGGRIRVAVDGRQVTLTGSVNTKSTADLAVGVARAVAGVEGVTQRVQVENDLAGGLIDKQIDRAIDSTQGRIADALLETRVKTALIEEMGKAAFAVEVEARDGAVSLTGAVPDGLRRALAVQTAQRTAGVKRVTDLLRQPG